MASEIAAPSETTEKTVVPVTPSGAAGGLQKMQESAVGDKTLCINCDLRISDTDAANSHCLKRRCLKCSRRHRSIVAATSDTKLVAWFNRLPHENTDEYRKVAWS